MLFGSGKSSSQSVVLLSTALNVTIASTSACIWIRTLNYEMHFNKILQEARRKSNPHKRRIRSSIVTFGAHRIYQLMIMPIFTYCGYNNLAWPESRKHMIHSIGKRCLEIIYPKFSPQNCGLRFLIIDNFLQKTACYFVFDCLNGTARFPFKNYFQRSHRNASNTLKTMIKQQNCERSLNTILQAVVFIFSVFSLLSS